MGYKRGRAHKLNETMPVGGVGTPVRAGEPKLEQMEQWGLVNTVTSKRTNGVNAAEEIKPPKCSTIEYLNTVGGTHHGNGIAWENEEVRSHVIREVYEKQRQNNHNGLGKVGVTRLGNKWKCHKVECPRTV